MRIRLRKVDFINFPRSQESGARSQEPDKLAGANAPVFYFCKSGKGWLNAACHAIASATAEGRGGRRENLSKMIGFRAYATRALKGCLPQRTRRTRRKAESGGRIVSPTSFPRKRESRGKAFTTEPLRNSEKTGNNSLRPTGTGTRISPQGTRGNTG